MSGRITFSYNMLFMTKPTPLLKWNCTSARVAGSTALVYMYGSVYECGGNGCTLYLLIHKLHY